MQLCRPKRGELYRKTGLRGKRARGRLPGIRRRVQVQSRTYLSVGYPCTNGSRFGFSGSTIGDIQGLSF